MQDEMHLDSEQCGFDDYSVNQFTASHVCVSQVSVGSEGVVLEKESLQEFNFLSGTQASVLMMPGFVVITNHPGKENILKAIEELQYRQDELKQDFSQAIINLAKSVKY